MDSIDREERILRITNIEEQDHGLYRCVRGDVTLNEILLDVLSKYILFSSFKSIDKLIYIYVWKPSHAHLYLCFIIFLFWSSFGFILTMQTCPRCVCIYMLTDLLSFRVLLIRIYTHIYMKRQKTIRLIRLHLDLLCICMLFLLFVYTGGLIECKKCIWRCDIY